MPRRARQRATTATDEDPCLFRIMPFATALLTLTLAHLPAANAGYFNCSVVYDEFDSLMHKQFLVEPDDPSSSPCRAGSSCCTRIEPDSVSPFFIPMRTCMANCSITSRSPLRVNPLT